MPSPREIRRRIKSISGTAKITRAMQMVASSKMHKAQQATLTTRPFARLLYRIQRSASKHAGDFTHPLMEAREVRKRAVVLIGTDRGLCGALNTNLFRVASQFDTATTTFIAVGKVAAQFIARTGRKLDAEYIVSDATRYAEVRPIAAHARDLFLSGEVDEVVIVTSRFINTLTQQALAVEFLPIGELKGLETDADTEAIHSAESLQFIFEPDPEAVLSYLFSHYVNFIMYRALLEARASEQSARMVAMKNATDNALGLIDELTLEYNKLRQGNITTELLDISGGQLGNE